MISAFLLRSKHKHTAHSNSNSSSNWPSIPYNRNAADDDTASESIPWPIPEPSYRRGTRRTVRTNDDDARGSGASSPYQGQGHQAMGATLPNWNISISNPIPRVMPNVLTAGEGHSDVEREREGGVMRSGRRNPIGGGSTEREWLGSRSGSEGEEEAQRSTANSRMRRLYPPALPQPQPIPLQDTPRKETPETIQIAQARAQALGPPQVVRIDSGASDDDEVVIEGDEAEKEDVSVINWLFE